jgi:hypothetical protein
MNARRVGTPVDMTAPDEPQPDEPQPDEPQPRDIALEQPSPELLEHLEEQSAPDQSAGPDQHAGLPTDTGADDRTDAQREATEFGGE